MKNLKKILTTTTFIFVFINSFAQTSYQNVSLFDQRVRSLDSRTYVREMVIIDFNNSGQVGSTIGYGDMVFNDDGRGNDLRAGDKIYTGTEIYNHDSKTPFVAVGRPISVMSKAVANSDFNKFEELVEYAQNYTARTYNGGGPNEIIEITCSISWGGCGCLACSYWGLCTCCLNIYNCSSITFGF